MEIENLKKILEQAQFDYEIIYHEKPVKSRNDALGYFKLEEMVPTLIIKTENLFYALIISGKREKVDLQAIQNLIGCKNLQMADKQEIKIKLNLETGRIPLVGHNLPCIIDEDIFNYDYVYGGTGDFMHTLKIKPKDLAKLNNTILKINLD
jgi:prolyl-tRNA editing enzyme YbaK/EbsC (Cys-tRNA(Pro) deacylase)